MITYSINGHSIDKITHPVYDPDYTSQDFNYSIYYNGIEHLFRKLRDAIQWCGAYTPV